MDTLFAKFININYYVALLPFRVDLVKRRDSYGKISQHYRIVKGPSLQRMLSGTLLSLYILQGIFLTRGSYWGKVVQHPSVLFLIWKTLFNSLILVLCWGWTFWRREKHSSFLTILEYLLKNRRIAAIPTDNQDHNANDKNSPQNWISCILMWTFLIGFGIIMPIVMELVQIFNVDGVGRPPTLGANFRIFSAQVLFDLFLVKNHTYISEEDFTSSYFYVSVIYSVFQSTGKVLLAMSNIFVFLTAVTFYMEVKKIHRETYSIKYNLRLMHNISRYNRFCGFMHQVNDMNRPILLCLVSSSVPLIVLRVIKAWDTTQLSIQIIILIKFVQFLAIILTSAEANHNAFMLKSRLLELCHQNNGEGGGWSGPIYRTDLGLDVGRFVTISYSFIGSMFSAYLSYAIMLLQITPCT